MKKQPEPLALRAAIPSTESAIKIHGGEGEGARITIDVYPEELGQLVKLAELRGKELVIVLQEAE